MRFFACVCVDSYLIRLSRFISNYVYFTYVNAYNMLKCLKRAVTHTHNAFYKKGVDENYGEHLPSC